MASRKLSLEAWIQRIGEQEMPIFGRTVQEIVSVSQDSETSASEMAQAVLRDSAMTAKVLRLANSSYYNPARNHVSTISRAVVLLGFDTVRSMCLSIALIDSLTQGQQREQVIQEMARSLHAAVQARNVALQRHDSSPEEVFVAALLYRLGDMAFWCFGGEHADALLKALAEPGRGRGEAEQEVLGFRLKRLTLGLVKEWHLNELLQHTLESGAPGKRAQGIELSHRLAAAAEQGWDSPAVRHTTEVLAELTGVSVESMQSLLHEGARQATTVAVHYGAASAGKSIPQPPASTAPARETFTPDAVPAYPEPDPLLQLKILRELSGLLQQHPDVNLLLEMVLEGLHRGVGLDRAVFALLTPDRRMLKAKFVLGARHDELLARFQFPIQAAGNDVFSEVIGLTQARWLDAARQPDVAARITPSMRERLGVGSFLAGPCIVGGKCIGLFYGDRGPSGRSLDDESFASFSHFISEANLGLEHITRGKQKG